MVSSYVSGDVSAAERDVARADFAETFSAPSRFLSLENTQLSHGKKSVAQDLHHSSINPP